MRPLRGVRLGSTLILADDGRLFSCGSAGSGHGHEAHDVVRPKQVQALRDVHVRGVASDYMITLAVTAAGRVYSWGNLALLPTLEEALADERVSMVAAGSEHACAVTEDGALFMWGCGRYGALGHGDEERLLSPRRVEALRGCRIATVATRRFHTLAAVEDGSVYGFGISSRLGFGTISHESQLTPKRNPNLKVRLG